MNVFENVDLLVKNGKLYTSAGFQDLDIGIADGEVAFLIKPGTSIRAKKTIDAKDRHVLPGIIDFHTHLRDPGMTHKEDFETGTRAAAAGGVTMVCPQPNVTPVPNTVENYRQEIETGEKKSLVDFNAIASPLLYEEGWVPKLAKEGALWFKIFQKSGAAYPYSTMAGTPNTAHIYEAFKEVAKTGLYCAIHPFDRYFFDEVPRIMEKQGIPLTLNNYLPLMRAEESMAGAAYELYYLAKRAKMRWYALHCHYPGYRDLVKLAKEEGKIDLIASCEFMHLISGVTRFYDAKRGEWFDFPIAAVGDEELEKAWGAIRDGIIDFIGTDHAPHLRAEIETKNPLDANLGCPSIEWYGHLLLNEVNKGTISLERLVEVTSVNGAKIFGLYPRKGALLPGSDGDLTICDLGKEWTIASEKVYTKCQLNPYHGRKIKGKVTHTVVRGEVVMEEGEVIGKPGYGKFVKSAA